MIICSIEPFALKQKIRKIETDDVYTSTLEDLVSNLVYICETENENHIHLYGNDAYCEEIKNDIFEYRLKNYNLEDIKIDIN